MNCFIRSLFVLFLFLGTVYATPPTDSLITDRGRGSREKPNLYDWNQQRLRDEGRYRSPGSTTNYYYQQDSDSDSYYYQTPKPHAWDERSIQQYELPN